MDYTETNRLQQHIKMKTKTLIIMKMIIIMIKIMNIVFFIKQIWDSHRREKVLKIWKYTTFWS